MTVKYYDANSISKYIGNNRPKSINIIHINIRSVRKNLDEFIINLEKTKTEFQVIILTEKWLNCQEDFNRIPRFTFSILWGRSLNSWLNQTSVPQ